MSERAQVADIKKPIAIIKWNKAKTLPPKSRPPSIFGRLVIKNKAAIMLTEAIILILIIRNDRN